MSSSTLNGDPEIANMKQSTVGVEGEEPSVAPGGESDPAEKKEAETVDTRQGQTQFVSDAPDGGTTAWLVVLGAWCTSFCSFGWINSIGTFQEYYETGPLSSYSASTIAWIPSLQVFFMMAMGPIVGRLFDAYGPRGLILGGTFLHVFGLMMASISTQYYQFLLAQGVCSAIGVAAVFQPAINCIAGWFHARRGAAYGILATGSSIGGVIFPIMISRLIRSVGYGWAMRSAAFLILGLLAVANVTVRARTPPRKSNVTPAMLAKPFKEPGMVLLMAGMFILTFGIYVPITYLPVASIAVGMSPDLAQYLIAMLNAASLFGRLLSGITADRIGKYNAFVIACYATGIFCVALWIPGGASDGGIIAFAVLFGFFSGAYVSLIAALVAQISPPPEIGFRTGLMFLVGSLPGLVTSPTAGAILQHTGGDWTVLKVFTAVFILVGTSVILAARVSFTGMKLRAVF